MKTKKQIKKKIKRFRQHQELIILISDTSISRRTARKVNQALEESERAINLLKWIIK